MNVVVRAVDETRILEVRLSGRFDETSVDALVSDPARGLDDSPTRWLVDTGTAEVDFTSERLTELAARLTRRCERLRTYRIHVIARDRLNYGCMRMLAAYLAETQLKVQVYSDADTARGELLAA